MKLDECLLLEEIDFLRAKAQEYLNDCKELYAALDYASNGTEAGASSGKALLEEHKARYGS